MDCRSVFNSEFFAFCRCTNLSLMIYENGVDCRINGQQFRETDLNMIVNNFLQIKFVSDFDRCLILEQGTQGMTHIYFNVFVFRIQVSD